MKAENGEIKDAGPGPGGRRAVTTPQTKGTWGGSAFPNPTRESCRKGLRGSMAFHGGTARLLRPSRQEASRENTPTSPSTLPCPTGAAHWQSALEGRKKPWHSAQPLLGQGDPKGRRDSFQHREMSHLCFPVGCSQVLLTAIVHGRPRRPWKSAWVWSQPELGLNPGPATCRLDRLLTLLRSKRAGTMMLAV